MSTIKNKQILLLGGGGFIGLHLAKKLLDLGAKVTIFGRSAKKADLIGLKGIKTIKGDIRKYNDLEKYVKNKDVIINLAAIVNPGGIFDEYEDLEINCRGQLNVLEARKNVNPNSKAIFIGTRAQFGRVNPKDLPIKEDYPQRPISLYGIHKANAERYCDLFYRTYKLPTVVLRLPQIYGPSLTKEQTHSIVEMFIQKVLHGETFYVYGHGNDLKDLVYIDDVVDLLVKTITNSVKHDVFNIGNGKRVKLIQIAKKIIRYAKTGSFKATPFPKHMKPFELGSYYADITKVKRKLKWKPKVDLDEGIKKTIEFYREK